MACNYATFRFYEELNDFLHSNRKKTAFSYPFEGRPAVKDVIEAIGIPHSEVDLVLINSEPVDLMHHLHNEDFVSVYPIFQSPAFEGLSHLIEKPNGTPKFILDVHLGKLARYLRMLGFDTLYNNTNDDPEIIRIALAEQRIILTRDIGLLKVKIVTQGYWVRSQQPKEQLKEVMSRYELYDLTEPFNRCVKCNGTLEAVEKDSILEYLEPLTIKYFFKFYRCRDCESIFWEGSHFDRMVRFIDEL